MNGPGHDHAPDASFDGGDLDCGSGLLLLIRSHIDPLPRGGLLAILSTEISVKEDLPAWCRLTGNELVSVAATTGKATSFLVCKGALAERSTSIPARRATAAPPLMHAARPVSFRDRLPEPSLAPSIPPLAVMGMGSWPRPRWMLQAVHDRLEGRLELHAMDHARQLERAGHRNEAALAQVAQTTRALYAAGDVQRTLANATAYLEAFGHVVLAWIWLDQSLAASRNYRDADSDFFHGKWQACRYFFVHELPKVDAWLDLVAALDTTTMDMKNEWF